MSGFQFLQAREVVNRVVSLLDDLKSIYYTVYYHLCIEWIAKRHKRYWTTSENERGKAKERNWRNVNTWETQGWAGQGVSIYHCTCTLHYHTVVLLILKNSRVRWGESFEGNAKRFDYGVIVLHKNM